MKKAMIIITWMVTIFTLVVVFGTTLGSSKITNKAKNETLKEVFSRDDFENGFYLGLDESLTAQGIEDFQGKVAFDYNWIDDDYLVINTYVIGENYDIDYSVTTKVSYDEMY